MNKGFFAAFALNSLCALGGVPMFAAMADWPVVEKIVDVDIESEVAVFRFPFTNQASEPILVKKIETSCSCTTSDSNDGKSVLSKNQGEVLITLDCSNRYERTRKSVCVYVERAMGESGVEKKVLTVIANIPRLFTVANESLIWQYDEGPQEKATELVFSYVDRIESVSLIQPDDGTFLAKVTRTEEKGKYQVLITPNMERVRSCNKDHSVDFGRICKILVKFKSGTIRSFNYWAMIRHHPE